MTRSELDAYVFDRYLFGAALDRRLRRLGLCPSSRPHQRATVAPGRSNLLTPRSGIPRGAMIPSDPSVHAAQLRAHEHGMILRVGCGRVTGVR